MVRPLLAALCLLGAAFAGCIGEAPPEDVNVLGDETNPLNDVPPDGRDGKLIAFEETNQTEAGVGGVDHHHDLWNNRGRVTLFETLKWMNPSPDSENRAVANFRVPQAAPGSELAGLVYEGTTAVEFTLTNPQRRVCEGEFTFGDGDDFLCTNQPLGGATPSAYEQAFPVIPDPGLPSQLKLRYQHSGTVDWIEVGDIGYNTPARIEITDPRQTDMPHSTASLWRFQIISANPHDVTLGFTAKAEIVRGPADIPLWPGHPVFYTEDKRVRTVLDAPVKFGEPGLYNTGAVVVPQDAGPSNPDKLISYGTRTLHVYANITKVTTGNPTLAPTTWYLRYANATGGTNITNPFDNANHSVEVKEHYWVINVDDAGMDSPYADGSRWEFHLVGALTTPAITCYSGCAAYVVEYQLKILATDVVSERYDFYSL